MFQAVRNTVFSGIAFQGALGDDIFDFLAYFGLRWGTHRRYFGHQWALIWGRNFRWILGAKMIDFWDSLRRGEMVAVGAAGLARGRNLILWYHAS